MSRTDQFMQAVWYERLGPAHEVLTCGEMPRLDPQPGEVRVRLAYSGVHPADCNRRAGRGFGMEWPRVIPHSDGSGVVDEVGEGVSASWLNQRVWLYNAQRGRALGTAAQWVCLDQKLVSRLPESVPLEVGACLGIPGMTAYHCLLADGQVQGLKVLITGGAGAVGQFAIRLAVAKGAEVIATASGEGKAAIARAAGASKVFNRHAPDLALQIRAHWTDGVDRIVEVDLGGNLSTTVEVIKPNGVVAYYASRGDDSPTLPAYAMMRKCVTLRAVLLPVLPEPARRLAQSEIGDWIGTVPSFEGWVDSVFPLSNSVAAHERVESGVKQGVVVVDCQT